MTGYAPSPPSVVFNACRYRNLWRSGGHASLRPPYGCFGIKQPHVSALMRNRAGNFSVGRLMEFLTALGQDVRITVKPTRKARGEMAVVAG